jgi:hypothetical protein
LEQGKVHNHITLILVLLFLLLLYCAITNARAFTTSTPSTPSSFPQQEIIDETRQWIDLSNKQLTSVGDRYTDIVAVNYFSNKNFLNATLWLLAPFNERPSRENVNYGMYIDADFNGRTGYGGVEYQIEIQWNNETKQWNKVIESWSPYGQTRVLENISNYHGFYENGGKFVVLSVDLDKLSNPQKFKVLYYAEVKKNGSYKTDFTRWVAIPPLQLFVSTSPPSLDIAKGEEKSIEVKVNSTQGYEPTINIYTANTSKDIFFNFAYSRLRIPSYGTATTPATITVSKNASSGPYTLFIFANSTFPAEQLIKPKTNVSSSDVRFSHLNTSQIENILSQTSMVLTINEPPSLMDQIGSSWQKLGGPVSFFYGAIAGISPWIYYKIRKSIKTKKNSKKD